MIKGVHQLTLRTNILIFSLIDHFTMFNGWMNSQADPCAELGFFFFFGGGGGGGGFRHDGQNTGSAHGTNPIRTYVRTHRQAHEYSCTGRRIDIHVHV